MPPCPDWCILERGHPWDSIHDGGLKSRGHAGPRFGEYVSVGSSEYEDNHGVHIYDVSVWESVSEVETHEEAFGLAADLLSAAAWVKAQR